MGAYSGLRAHVVTSVASAARAPSRSSTRPWRSPVGPSIRPTSASPPTSIGSKPAVRINRVTVVAAAASVRRVEEHDGRFAVRDVRKLGRTERPECLHVVRACREQAGDDRAGRLVFRQRPDHLSVFEPDRVRRVDDDLAVEPLRVVCEHALQRVEPDGEDDGVGTVDCVPDRGCACERSEIVRERLRPGLVFRSEDDCLAAVHEVPCNRPTEVADADDCGCHDGHRGRGGRQSHPVKPVVRDPSGMLLR